MTNNKSPIIPLLVTLDLEIARDHDLQEQRVILERLGKDLQALNLPITVFATSDAVKAFPEQVRWLKTLKHDIGLHGMTHSFEENFSKLTLDKIRNIIGLATAIIEDVTGFRPLCFRGPFMTTSSATHKALLENGYIADLSVCSQRIDVFNAIGFNLGWLTAPRGPYLPSEYSPYKKGKVPLLMVPLSCMGFPFVSGSLYLLGPAFMKLFFNLLLCEARCSLKPIVYLFHSYEFCSHLSGGNKNRLHRIYEQNREKRYLQNLLLLKHMSDAKNVQPLTASGYVKSIQNKFKSN